MGRERERLETHEQRLRIYERDEGTCRYCKKAVDINSFQVSHLIARTVWTIKLFGKDVIEHSMNKACTHAGACNDLIQITNKPVERERLAQEIREKISGKELF